MAKLRDVVRDLVLKPRLTRDPVMGAGLGALAKAVSAPLFQLPAAALRLPDLARQLGARGLAIPPERRRTPSPSLALSAVGLLARTDGGALRDRVMSLLCASMDSAVAGEVHPGFLEVLRQLTEDEARLLGVLESDGPYPVISVVSRMRHGGGSQVEMRHFSLLGEAARAAHPERVPLYLDNFCRLGLVELRPTRLSEDTRMFAPLENHPEVVKLRASIESQPAVALRGVTEPIVADVQYISLFVTTYGRQFQRICTYQATTDETAVH